MSSIRATKRCAAAAAGVGMVLASFAGAAASATASTSHHANHHNAPAIIGAPSGAYSASAATKLNNPLNGTALTGGTVSVALPTITINDPTGIITPGATVTLTLTGGGAANAALSGSPSVSTTGSATGVAVSGSARPSNTTVTFVAASGNTSGAAAVYTISGLSLAGSTTAGAINVAVTANGSGSGNPAITAAAATIHVGATTTVATAAAGAQAPDTAAVLFRAAFLSATTPTSLVVTSDSEPQDAESANYLAKNLATGVVLTDPTTLSSAVSGIITQYTNINHIYIVGGTSVVSSSVQAALTTAVSGRTGASAPQVTRYSGTSQYDTNQAVLTAVASHFPGITPTPTTVTPTSVILPFNLDLSYNTTGGASSPTSLGTGAAAKTAIIVSGEIASYQDGVAGSALSYGDTLPVVMTTPSALSASATAALAYGGYTQVIVLGGPLAVSDSVVNSLIASNINVLRVAGSDASATAALLASLEITAPGSTATHAATGLAFSTTDGTGVVLARGNGFQDALAAGAYAGGNTHFTTGGVFPYTPILLSETGTTLGGSSTSGLTQYLGTLGAAGVFAVQPIGGNLSVTPALTSAATTAEVAGTITP